jgi:hypothetical protein
MRSDWKRLALALVSAGFLTSASSRSEAGMITYTETVQATGILGGSFFSNDLLTFTFVGDTTNVTGTPGGLYQNRVGTATVSVNGMTYTLTSPSEVADDQMGGSASIGEGFAILGVQNTAFNAYDLTTSIGPITGSTLFMPGPSFATSGGSLSLFAVAQTATFQASVIPEPASLLMMCLGIACVAAVLGFQFGPTRPEPK